MTVSTTVATLSLGILVVCFLLFLRAPAQEPAQTPTQTSEDAAVVQDSGRRSAIAPSRDAPHPDAVRTPAEQSLRNWIVAVVDRDGKPIPQAHVVSGGSGAESVGRSNAIGECDVPMETRCVVAFTERHLPGVARYVGNPRVTLSLQTGQTLAGRVIDQDSTGVEGALVRVGIFGSADIAAAASTIAPDTSTRVVQPRLLESGCIERILETRTSGDGSFQLNGIQPGRHRICCIKNGFLLDGASGNSDAQTLEVSSAPQRIEYRLRRVYVACCTLAMSNNWPGTAALRLTRRTLRSPAGLKLVADEPLAPQLAKFEVPSLDTSPSTVRYFATAQDGSHLAGAIDALLTIDVWAQAARQESIQFVPLDNFRPGDVRTIAIDVPGSARTFVAKSPVKIALLSVAPSGFGFEPDSSEGGDHMFLVPDGTYRITAALPILLNRKRFEQITIDESVVVPRKVTAFDNVGTIYVLASDGEHQPTTGTFMVSCTTKHRGDLMLSVAQAAQTLIPCEPGTYEVVFRNQAGLSMGSKTVDVQAGETVQCCVDIKL